jgi:hypothetical protein
MDVHAAGHHHHPTSVQLRCVGRKTLHYAAVLDADVADLAVHPIGGIVDRPACNP